MLAKRYSLPSEDVLGSYFEVGPLGKEHDPLREIIKKIAERLDMLSQNLEGIIQPEHLAGLMEVDVMPEAQKNAALELYKTLLFLFREAQIQLIAHDSESSARYIREVCAQWPTIQARAIEIFSAARDTWKSKRQAVPHKESSPDRSPAGYFG
jgi:hypothetical protein